MNFKMNAIIEMFRNVMSEMELFYSFNNVIIQRYNQNINRNYQLLKNINDLISFNSKFLGEMSIFKTDNYINILKNCNYKLFYGINEKEFNDNCIKAKNKVFEINTN